MKAVTKIARRQPPEEQWQDITRQVTALILPIDEGAILIYLLDGENTIGFFDAKGFHSMVALSDHRHCLYTIFPAIESRVAAVWFKVYRRR